MAVSERDPYTGKLTTGHDWNGIKELDTPIPVVVLLFLAAGTLFAVVWTILMPAWPMGRDYTRGLLGVDQRQEVQQSLAEAAAERAAWTARIESEDFAAIAADPGLMAIVRQAGGTLFAELCRLPRPHGRAAGLPNIAQAPTLWGGRGDHRRTIRVGINSSHPETRFAECWPSAATRC